MRKGQGRDTIPAVKLTADDFVWAGRMVSWQARRHPHLEEDIKAEAALELHRASLTWDPGRGVPFRSYAVHWVRWAVIHFLRNQNRSLSKKHPGMAPLSFTPLTDRHAETLSVNDEEPEDLLDQRRAPDRLAKLLATLPRRWAGMVKLHLIDGRTLEDAGAAFGVTMQRAKQMIDQALRALVTGERIVVNMRKDRVGYDGPVHQQSRRAA